MVQFNETAVRIIDKQLKDDEGFTNHVINEMSRRLADRIIGILDSEDEIIVKQSDLRVSEDPPYLPYNAVEYRRQISWQPLVRCKECIWRNESTCLIHGAIWKDNDFCSQGKRRTDDEEQLAAER